MKIRGRWQGDGGSRGGFAILAVLMVLLALLVLCAPFLLTARNATKASAQTADLSQVRMALDSAVRHARARLAPSHPSTDDTPYFDTADELAVDNRFPEDFLNASDPRGVMWDLDVSDVAGLIDLNSAGPYVFANIMEMYARVTQNVESDADTIPVSGGRGFEPRGYVVIRGEIVSYDGIEEGALQSCGRGWGAEYDEEGGALPCGPRPPMAHDFGTPVLDQRALAPVLWRVMTGDGSLRRFDATEQLREAGQHALADSIGEEGLDALRRLGTVYGEVRGGRRWQRAGRLTRPIEGGTDCRLEVQPTRYYNVGATVQVSDGQRTEIGVVQRVGGGGIYLDQPLVNSYDAYTAEVRVLSRRPVNVNVAPQEVLEVLFANLQLRGVNSRITGTEAEALAELVIASRPFEGLEDFLRRVVLPAAGLEPLPEDAPVQPEALAGEGGVLDSAHDALALYTNALNANDGTLLVSTMPFCFTSRDTYDMQVRATVNAPSGVLRVSRLRQEVSMFVPQEELIQLWARQEDFDEALRLDREAPWWMTGPHSTSRWDQGEVPPTRLWAHMGTYEGRAYLPGVTTPPGYDPESPPTPEHVFAERGEADLGWAQLFPSRVEESGPRQGRMLHFDHETRDLEGRYLPDQTLVRRAHDPMVGFNAGGSDPFMLPCELSLWVKPRTIGDSVIFDVGGSSIESDRVTLQIEGEDLVLRVLDAVGDHPETAVTEAGEARMALAPGDGPGLAADTWSHLSADVRGNRPDQINLWVDGASHGVRTPGLTHLVGALSSESSTILVDSTEGFPDRCTLRIANEVIEAVKTGANSFTARADLTGVTASYGGRLAREMVEQQGGGQPPVSTALFRDTDHAANTPVMLYGYSLPVADNVPNGSSQLSSDLGMFAAGVVEQVHLSSGGSQAGEPLTVMNSSFIFGLGMEGINSEATGLVLAPADPLMTPEELMSAFNPGGGYCLVMQKGDEMSWTVGSAGGGSQTYAPGDLLTVNGTPIFGYEIVRYTGIDQDTLLIDPSGRGDGHGFQNPNAPEAERRAFVVEWQVVLAGGAGGGIDPNLRKDWQTFVIPISLHAAGASGVASYLPGGTGLSEFAQITHLDQAELTEWVRYDEIAGEWLVRNEDAFLQAAKRTAGLSGGGTPRIDPPGGGGGGGGGGGDSEPRGPEPDPPPAAPAAPSASQQSGSYWIDDLGSPEDDYDGWPLSKAVASVLQFRGVLGTYIHTHSQGTTVVPVWRTYGGGPDSGHPGRLDDAFLVEGAATSPGDPGWPVRVHFARQPSTQYEVYDWRLDRNDPWTPLPPDGSGGLANQAGFHTNHIHVALQEAAPIPIVGPAALGLNTVDTRMYGRLVKFPSGELPRVIDRVTLGSSVRGGMIPDATIDEVLFGATQFGSGTSYPLDTRGGQLVLEEELSVGDDTLQVHENRLRIPRGLFSEANAQYLDALPQHAGLLRIGGEIVCYDTLDGSSGVIVLAQGGRGLLGTEEQHHEEGESVTYLDGWTVSILTNGTSEGDSHLALESLDEFSSEGTVRIDDELLHFTRQRSGALEMPRASSVPGINDEKGDGLFRGRYGTDPAAHLPGAPVILHPFRYWDRWTERADAPELSYLGLACDQPSAFWRGSFWVWESSPSGSVQIGTLQRSDPAVPWDASPDETEGLDLLWEGMPGGGFNPIGAQSDRVEWRVFTRWAPGAFDALGGLSHGWKETPRLKTFGVQYLGPNVTLRRVDH